MPTSRPSIAAFTLTNIRLFIILTLVIVPFSMSAVPMSPQEPASSPPGYDSPRMTRDDIIFAIIFVLFVVIFGWFSFPSLVAAFNRFRDACRPLVETVPSLRLDDLFQRLADAIVGTGGATPTSQTDGGATETPPQPLGQSAPPAGIVAVPHREGSIYHH